MFEYGTLEFGAAIFYVKITGFCWSLNCIVQLDL